MIDRKLFQETFSTLHASPDTLSEVYKVVRKEPKHHHPISKGVLIAAVLAMCITVAAATGIANLIKANVTAADGVTAADLHAFSSDSIGSDTPIITDNSGQVLNLPRMERVSTDAATMQRLVGDYLSTVDATVEAEGYTISLETFLIDENGQLADSQPVYIRNPELAHEREEARLHEAAFYLIAAQRVRPVKNHYFNTFLGTGPHHQSESADESVGPGPDILDVINHYVDALQHLLGRLAIFPVDGINLYARCSVHRIVHLVPGVGIPADTVLRAEKGHEIDILGLIEYVDCGTEVAVHPARICHKTHTLALKPFKATAFEHLDAGTHLHSRGSIKHCRQECQQNGNQRSSHIFHFLTTLPYSGSTFSRQVTPAVAMQQTITIQKKFT